MGEAAKNSLDIPQHNPSGERPVTSKERNYLSANELLASLDEQNTPPSNPEAKEVVTRLLSACQTDHCFTAVKEDINGDHDSIREPLYKEALEPFCRQLYWTMNLPSKTEEELEKKWRGNEALDQRDVLWISRPNTAIDRLIEGIHAPDISKIHISSSYAGIKTVLHRFFAQNEQWFQSLPVPQLKSIEEKLLNLLTIIDSLAAINERNPKEYPNQKQPPALLTQKLQQLPKTSIADIKAMFDHPVPARPSDSIPHDDQEHEQERWLLHLDLVSNAYQKLCATLHIEESKTCNAQISTLRDSRLSKTFSISLLEKLLQNIETKTIQQIEKNPSLDLLEIKMVSRSIVEQIDFLKKVALRNQGKESAEGEGEQSRWRKTISWVSTWAKKLLPEKKHPTNNTIHAKAQAIRKPRSLKSLWLMAAFSSFTSFFGGQNMQRKAPETQTEPAPITVLHLPSENPPSSTTPPSTTEDHRVTETPTQDTTILAHSSIQKRLQKTLKGQQARAMFEHIYGQTFTLNNQQANYLANTFAHIIRPHLRHFHSNTDTSPLQIEYLGPTHHHKHEFRVSSGTKTETVRVNIPSWYHLNQGLQHNQSSVPPVPPDSVSSTVHDSSSIMAALDQLQQSDQIRDTRTSSTNDTVTQPSPPTPAELALEELARSDATKAQRTQNFSVPPPSHTAEEMLQALAELHQSDLQPRNPTPQPPISVAKREPSTAEIALAQLAASDEARAQEQRNKVRDIVS